MSTSSATLIVHVHHPRHYRASSFVARHLVRLLPQRHRSFAYWRLLDALRASPSFELIEEWKQPEAS